MSSPSLVARRGRLLVAFWAGVAALPLLVLAGFWTVLSLAWTPPYHDLDLPEDLAIGLVLWTPAVVLVAVAVVALVLRRRGAAWWWTAPAGCAVCVLAIGVAAVLWLTSS